MGLIVQKHSFTFNPTLRLLACCQLAFLSGCGGDPDQEDLMDTAAGDYADESYGEDFGIAEIAENLGTGGVTCVVSGVAPAQIITFVVDDSKTLLISKKLLAGAVVATTQPLLINGGAISCAGVDAPTSAMQIVVNRQNAPIQRATVILDYMGGVFSVGSATAVGVDLSALLGADVVKIRATKAADAFTVGGGGLGVDAGYLADIKLPGKATTFQLALGAGADVFSTAGGVGLVAVNTVGAQYAGTEVWEVSGGAGADVFKAAVATDGMQKYIGGDDADTVDYGLRSWPVHITTAGAMADDGEGGEKDNVADDIETVKGGFKDDVIDCTGSAPTVPAGTIGKIVYGGAGADILTGSAYVDTLNGDAGDDILDGGLGDDKELGGTEDDTFYQGTLKNGADTLTGGGGVDTVSYVDRNDLVAIITVNLLVAKEDGEPSENDDVTGADVENVTGSLTMKNVLTGSALNNVLVGGNSADTILGGLGDDTIVGGAGVDTLSGEAGDDTIESGAQADIVDCGLGDDLLLDVPTGSVTGCTW